jgi:hypothetical protein
LSDQKVEGNTTRATAREPGLDIEIIHRRLFNDEAEQISINLQAMRPLKHLAGILRRPTHLHSGFKLFKWRGSLGLTPRVLRRCLPRTLLHAPEAQLE